MFYLLKKRWKNNMLNITFRYRDEMSKGQWVTQQCTVSSVEECKRIYGLDTDETVYDYEILKVEEITDGNKRSICNK